jgi:hypothetical protein
LKPYRLKWYAGIGGGVFEPHIGRTCAGARDKSRHPKGPHAQQDYWDSQQVSDSGSPENRFPFSLPEESQAASQQCKQQKH